MKSGYRCYHEWCGFKFNARPLSASSDYSSCSCSCDNHGFPSFVPSMQRCINTSLVASFAGCQHYINSDTLLVTPVDLSTGKPRKDKTFEFKSNGETTCSLNGSYFHDCEGFHSRWQRVAEGFFTLRTNGSNYDVEWQADTDQRLSGRIIRLQISCATSSHCFLFKALGVVTYNASSSSSTGSTLSSSSSSSSSLSPSLSVLPPAKSLVLSRSSAHSSLSPLLPQLTSPYSLVKSHAVAMPSVNTREIQATSYAELQTSSFYADETTDELVPTVLIQQPSTGVTVFPIPIEPSKTTASESVSAAGDIFEPGGHEAQTGGTSDGILIGAALGGTSFVGAAAVIMLFIFWKRRRAGGNTEKQNKRVANPVYGITGDEIQVKKTNGEQTVPSAGAQENQETYQDLNKGKNSDAAIYSNADGDYDNCAVYQSLEKQTPGCPVYMSLDLGQAKPPGTTGLKNINPKRSTSPDPKSSATGPVNSTSKVSTGLPNPKAKNNTYTTGKSRGGHAFTQGPTYSVLYKAGADQVTTSDALYSDLEGPNSGEDYETPNDDLMFPVLVEPKSSHMSSESGLEKNKLEDPDDAKSPYIEDCGTSYEPLYNVLDGPNSDGSEKPRSNEPRPASGRDNPAYEQTLDLDQSYVVLEEQDTNWPTQSGRNKSHPPSRYDNLNYEQTLELHRADNLHKEPQTDGPKQPGRNEHHPSSSHKNPAYKQTLEFDQPYAAPHRPGTESESLYEPLRRGPTQ